MYGWGVFDGPAEPCAGGDRGGGEPGRGGPPPAIRGEVEAALTRMLAGNGNHLTLAECRDRLAAEMGVRVHPWTVGRALRRIGWT